MSKNEALVDAAQKLIDLLLKRGSDTVLIGHVLCELQAQVNNVRNLDCVEIDRERLEQITVIGAGPDVCYPKNLEHTIKFLQGRKKEVVQIDRAKLKKYIRENMNEPDRSYANSVIAWLQVYPHD